MNRLPLSRLAVTFAVAPLVLGLAACGKKEGGDTTTKSEAVAKAPPPAGKAWTDVVSKTAEGGYLMGNPNAPIKLVEFGALSCSHCAEFSEKSSAELRDKFVASGQVSYELRLFMLNALDMPAALLVTCGAPETVPALAEQFWAWQPHMFEGLQKAGDAQMQAIQAQKPPQSFVSLAQIGGMTDFITSRGIAAPQAAACLADGKKATDFAQQTQTASTKYEITGTPTFMIDGDKVTGNTWPEIKTLLENKGAR